MTHHEAITFRFAQLSDLHLSDLKTVRWHRLTSKRLQGYLSWRYRRHQEHRPEILDALRKDLLAQAPDHTVITGDLTQIALPEEFTAARHWLQTLGSAHDVTVIPGNHDRYVRTSWEDSCGQWSEYMLSDHPDPGRAANDPFPLLRVRAGVAFIGLDSAIPAPPFMAIGRIGTVQLTRLEALLRDLQGSGLLRVLLLHHPPVPGEEKWRKRLVDAPALCALLQRHPVDLVLHGHRHRAQQSTIRRSGGSIPVFGIPSASAAGMLSPHAAEYNVYTVTPARDGWRVRIDARGYDASATSFNQRTLATIDVMRRPGEQGNPVAGSSSP